MTEAEQSLFQTDMRLLQESLDNLRARVELSRPELDEIRGAVEAQNVEMMIARLVTWLSDFYRLVQELGLVQARARLEAVVVEPISLESDFALRVALANRLDLMNNRANLVDSWRLIAFNADALQAGLNVVLSGDMRTTRDNPLSFEGSNSVVRAGLQFDAPFTRLLERNNYRQSLIDYQRDRRQFIQSIDSLNLTLRQILRQIEQLRVNLEIQRRAVAISIRRVDLTREDLNRPVPPAEPGQPANQLGPTAALNLLTALSDLRSTQNNFMSVWLNYYAMRMRLVREMGIMKIDDQGRWIDEPIEQLLNEQIEEVALPPAAPEQWFDLVPEVDAGSQPYQDKEAAMSPTPAVNVGYSPGYQQVMGPNPPNLDPPVASPVAPYRNSR